MVTMDRFWFLTWTTYGSWLPGDERGFVSRVREGAKPNGPRIEHDKPQTPTMQSMPGLFNSSSQSLKCPPIRLSQEQANVVADDLANSARFRGWALLAGSVMANHVHAVVGVPGDPKPESLRQIFKSYASRALNQRWGKPASETWWTESGSNRKLKDEEAVLATIWYVENQESCLARCPKVNVKA